MKNTGSAENLPKKIELALLFSVYGQVLNENRIRIMNYFLYDDLSLSEISDIEGITRQGVHDSIKKSEQILRKMESKLHIMNRIMDMRKEVESFHSVMNELDDINELKSAADNSMNSIMQMWEENYGI